MTSCKIIIFPSLHIIECPPATDGMERFACPTPDRQGRYRCIDDHVLCDGFIDCPEGADEDRQACMFYKTVSCWLHSLSMDANSLWIFICRQKLIWMSSQTLFWGGHVVVKSTKTSQNSGCWIIWLTRKW